MSELSDELRALLAERRYATLATHDPDGTIHLTPVWFLFDDERFISSRSLRAGRSGTCTRMRRHRSSSTRDGEGGSAGSQHRARLTSSRATRRRRSTPASGGGS